MLKIPITNKSFTKYGQIVQGYDFNEICEIANKEATLPSDGTMYVAGFEKFESLPIAKELKQRAYGKMDIQLGYCSGQNTMLNALEYHKGSEIIIAATPLVLLLASITDMQDFKINSDNIQAFYMQKGEAVELYATTLHYAPCKTQETGFMAIIVLPKGTNLPLEQKPINPQGEDKILFMKNKWLIAHKESNEAKQGVTIGIIGDNLHVEI